MSVLIFILIGIFCLKLVKTESNWSSIYNILSLQNATTLSLDSVFHDISHDNYHIMATTEDAIYYLKTDSAGKILKSEYIENFVTPGSSITGYNGNLYRVTLLYGFLYFSESADNGETWTKYIKLHDILMKNVNLFVVKETGRIFIVFRDELFNMYSITRPPGSSLFTTKTKIDSEVFNAPVLSTYTHFNGKTTIHLFATYGTGNLTYFKSENNGIDWSNPFSVDGKFSSQPIAVAANSEISQFVFTAIYERFDSAIKLSYTYDNGLNFIEPMRISKTQTPLNRGALMLCGSKQSPFLASVLLNKTYEIYENSTSTLEYSFWMSLKYPVYQECPIADAIDAKLSCNFDNMVKKTTVTLFAVQSDGEGLNIIMTKNMVEDLNTEISNT